MEQMAHYQDQQRPDESNYTSQSKEEPKGKQPNEDGEDDRSPPLDGFIMHHCNHVSLLFLRSARTMSVAFDGVYHVSTFFQFPFHAPV